MTETNNSIEQLLSRTLDNLKNCDPPNEVTHLINSCLAIIVYTFERTKESRSTEKPSTPQRFNLETSDDVKRNLYILRHALSHGNIHFNSIEGEISEIIIWNRDPSRRTLTHFAVVSVANFTKAIKDFADGVIQDKKNAGTSELPSDVQKAIRAEPVAQQAQGG